MQTYMLTAFRPPRVCASVGETYRTPRLASSFCPKLAAIPFGQTRIAPPASRERNRLANEFGQCSFLADRSHGTRRDVLRH
ncbi:hypothetical protein ACQP1G_12955 [Nocardia sp. CA-107356]|uniref:hypothetical protein n=1 Tax=Nocardia sp. CA-107356 TaxID=3239972 RepID=UPI003D94BE9E